MSERDPLDELRAAWSSLEAPDATPERADAETEAVVAALREAWRVLEPPPVRVPLQLRLRLLKSQRPALTRLAAAAVLLLAAGVLARGLLAPTPRIERSSLEARLPAAPARIHHPRMVESAAIEDGIVMTHGKVRLVMLTPQPTLDEFEVDHTNEESQ